MLASQLSPLDNVSSFDLVIVGAGLVGSTLAATLAGTSLRIALIEAHDIDRGPGPDGRASALALGTTHLLQQIGAWKRMQQLGVSPIHQIQVSDGEAPLKTQLCREEIQVEALGYVVENRVTLISLQEILGRAQNVEIISPARVLEMEVDAEGVDIGVDGPTQRRLRSQLLIAADGRNSLLRQLQGIPVSAWGYNQICVVSQVETEKGHDQVAYERFQPQGPFAILPMTAGEQGHPSHRACVVWTLPASQQEEVMSLGDQDFCQAIAPAFGPQLGQIKTVSPRSCYRPQRLHACQYVTPRFALVGDAAHATHPVGGQGVNMGMRDVALLASLLYNAQLGSQDLGRQALLHHYQRARRIENLGVLFATDVANHLFSNQFLPLQWGRRLGLWGLNHVSPLKAMIMRQAMGIATYQPQLHPELRGLPPQPSPLDLVGV
ncbi:MAG: UbiH/UbiF/VisC/COQ6 family ubiquinone biosynthesis hydroxylase [Synechococcaceae cyanobacterium SM2_3_1]|nr:UbiH/UbiF/VisC/COQ6 family ubiquinone biosynthesis hydroxylase [Synechococcaceae cyanobacterium SM2_3_1]